MSLFQSSRTVLLLFVFACVVVGADAVLEFIWSTEPQESHRTKRREALAVFDALYDAIGDESFRDEVTDKIKKLKAKDSENMRFPCDLSFVTCDDNLIKKVRIFGLSNALFDVSKLPQTVEEILVVGSEMSNALEITDIPSQLRNLTYEAVKFSSSVATIQPRSQRLSLFTCPNCGLTEVSLSASSGLTHLDLSENPLSKLTVDDFPHSLQVLKLKGFQSTMELTELFDALPSSLVSLDISNSRLTRKGDDLKTVSSSLRELDISGTNFDVDASLIFSALASSKVTHLRASRCGLTGDLTRVDILNLQKLDLSENKISFISWSGMPSGLEILNVSRNELKGGLALKDLSRSLKTFDVSRNKLSESLNLSDLPPQMEFLDISENEFSGEIDLTRLPESIRYAYIQHNKFEGSPNLVDLPVELRHILVHHNNWESLLPSL